MRAIPQDAFCPTMQSFSQVLAQLNNLKFVLHPVITKKYKLPLFIVTEFNVNSITIIINWKLYEQKYRKKYFPNSCLEIMRVRI